MDDKIERLHTALMVLNTIDVRGKQNMLNLGGAIDLIENVIKMMVDETVEEPEAVE